MLDNPLLVQVSFRNNITYTCGNGIMSLTCNGCGETTQSSAEDDLSTQVAQSITFPMSHLSSCGAVVRGGVSIASPD